MIGGKFVIRSRMPPAIAASRQQHHFALLVRGETPVLATLRLPRVMVVAVLFVLRPRWGSPRLGAPAEIVSAHTQRAGQPGELLHARRQYRSGAHSYTHRIFKKKLE